MISSIVSRLGPYRFAGVLVLAALAAAACGCGGSSDQGATDPNRKKIPLEELVPEEKLYHYVGTGTAKRKEDISRRERVQLRREAMQKAESK